MVTARSLISFLPNFRFLKSYSNDFMLIWGYVWQRLH